MLDRLNMSTLYSRLRNLDVLFLISAFKYNIICPSIFNTVSIRIEARIIRDYSTFAVKQSFKVSPSARCVSASNAICKDIGIFKKVHITLNDLL
jgi:hypothetical protein